MDLLIIVSNPDAGAILKPLGEACGRAGADWAVFLTNDGVKVLGDPSIAAALSSARQAFACKESWDHHCGGQACPVELGSQTNNSEMAGAAARIVSL
jgi:hypothetical protein